MSVLTAGVGYRSQRTKTILPQSSRGILRPVTMANSFNIRMTLWCVLCRGWRYMGQEGAPPFFFLVYPTQPWKLQHKSLTAAFLKFSSIQNFHTTPVQIPSPPPIPKPRVSDPSWIPKTRWEKYCASLREIQPKSFERICCPSLPGIDLQSKLLL